MNVLISDYNAATRTISSPRRLTLTEDLSFTLAWTLDSSAVLFRSNRLGNTGVFGQSLNRTDADLVVAAEGRISNVAISPDRQWILFQRSESVEEKSSSHLLRISASDGSEQEILAGKDLTAKCGRSARGRCLLAEVSPAKNELVFSEFDPLLGKRSELARAFRNHADETRWFLSPDGNQVALFDHLAESFDVLSLTDHRTRKILLSRSVHLRSVTWSASGDGFFVCSAVTRGAELLFVDLDGNSHKLWELSGGTPYLQTQSSPDGKHLAIDAAFKNSNLWVLEDF